MIISELELPRHVVNYNEKLILAMPRKSTVHAYYERNGNLYLLISYPCEDRLENYERRVFQFTGFEGPATKMEFSKDVKHCGGFEGRYPLPNATYHCFELTDADTQMSETLHPQEEKTDGGNPGTKPDGDSGAKP